MIVKKLIDWLKNNSMKILIFILVIIFLDLLPFVIYLISIFRFHYVSIFAFLIFSIFVFSVFYFFIFKKEWLKNNSMKIIIFILLIIFGIWFHVVVLVGGSIHPLTFFSIFAFLIFSFSIFKKFYKKFFGFILFLILLQTLIFVIPFPVCLETNKSGPEYGCECNGVRIDGLIVDRCIGKIEKCYAYGIYNPNFEYEEARKLYREDKYHPDLEVSCEDFPQE